MIIFKCVFLLIARLPGKAYVDRQHIWLTRANKADSTLFSRTILAEVHTMFQSRILRYTISDEWRWGQVIVRYTISVGSIGY